MSGLEALRAPKHKSSFLRIAKQLTTSSFKHSLTSQTMKKTKPRTPQERSTEAWQVQTAKARFSEIFRRARNEGPQRITRQGKEGVVMVAEEAFDQLTGRSHQPRSLVEFFRKSPMVGVDLDLRRQHDSERDIEL